MSRHAQRASVERLVYSSSNYWFALFVDLSGIALFLAIGLRGFVGSLAVAISAVSIGIIAWGVVEYSVHRWVLHGRPSIASRAHARHHADGEALISAPVFMGTALAFATWACLSIPLTAGTAALSVLGLYTGYNYYALLHHLEHRQRARLPRLQWLTRLEQSHRIHHTRRGVNYGVSTTWCDRLFRSYQAPSPGTGQAPDRAGSTGRSWPASN